MRKALSLNEASCCDVFTVLACVCTFECQDVKQLRTEDLTPTNTNTHKQTKKQTNKHTHTHTHVSCKQTVEKQLHYF